MPPLRRGRSVHVRYPRPSDRAAFLEAVRGSRRLHRPWVSPPVDDEAFARFAGTARRDDSQRLLICANDDGALVGVANLTQIVYGPFRNAYLGFYAFSPFDGRGLMKEGLSLCLRHAFGERKLHRVQAAVQPGNDRSLALLRSLGFTEEGHARRYLKIGGRWRDHVIYAILAEDLPRQQLRHRSL